MKNKINEELLNEMIKRGFTLKEISEYLADLE